MSTAFPFRAARPKGAKPANDPPSMSFELPQAPPAAQPPPEPEIPFEEVTEPPAQLKGVVEIIPEETDDMAKRKRGRPAKPAKTAPPARNVKRFTFQEVLEVIGEDEPVLKVVSRITPIIEVLPPAERTRVVDILVRLYSE